MITDKGDYLEYYGGPVKACPLEKIDQMNSVSWLRHEYPDYLFWHTVNEGSKHKASAVIDHQMGLLKTILLLASADAAGFSLKTPMTISPGSTIRRMTGMMLSGSISA